MPSFRVTMRVGELRPGVTPDRVLPAAAAAVEELATVEASEVGVVSGEPRITVRFTEDAPDIALQIGEHAASVVDSVVPVVSWTVTQRVGGRWHPVGK
ncbi:hypothetical protein [Diaminobutyricimonas sp. LJ205]|uniref:hypothetical protein n=1 Tax=Diaminobutyricimonas sp. LJ205 TaxID=2683590 RepID=UPI0012F4E3E4|nr:hypothetical protein [Diaminobutyricimonas sp. LJ205]